MNTLQLPREITPVFEPAPSRLTGSTQRRPLRPFPAKWLGGAAALLVTGALAAWGWNARQFESTDNAVVDGHLHPVSARVAGTVVEVFVADNQHVTAGQPLFRLDPRDLEVALAEAHARVAEAEAAVALAEAGAVKAGLDFDRARSLFEGVNSGIIPKSDFDAARASRDAAQASLAAARARHTTALAVVDAATLQLGYTTVTAPATGRLARRNVEPGQRIQPGQQVLSLVGEELWITANFKETQLAHLCAGQAVTLVVDALDGVQLRGEVDSFAPGTGARFSLLPADNATGNFTKIVQRIPVKIRLAADTPETVRARLAPGLSVVARVRVAGSP